VVGSVDLDGGGESAGVKECGEEQLEEGNECGWV